MYEALPQISQILIDRFKQDVERKDRADFNRMENKMREFSKDLGGKC